MSDRRGGFTIVEVLIAIILLSIGVLALTSSAATVTRMMTNGSFKTKSYAITQARAEKLRTMANKTTPACTDANFASGSRALAGYPGFSEAWQVSVSDKVATVRQIVIFRDGYKVHVDTTNTTIYCP